MQSLETDVAVVGAGPGGATLALLLARSGVDVTLFERHGDLAREFRGYLFQPLVLRAFDEMGIAEDVLALDHDEVESPAVSVYGRDYDVVDFSAFEPYGFGLLMEQPALLRLLVDRASEFENFTYRDRTPVEELRRDDEGRVTGMVAHDREGDEELTVDARLVVGADGRYSTVRDAAGIDPGLFDSSVELIWFKLPRDVVPEAAQFTFGPGGLVLYFGLGVEEGQAGYFVPKGTYADLRERGIDAFRERLEAADPRLHGELDDHLRDFSDCSLLHVEPGFADTWTNHGLLLLGDAAHVASPVGAQGNSLAIQDAIRAHPAICDALAATPNGPIPRAAVLSWELERRRDVHAVMRFQRFGERLLSAYIHEHDRIPRWLERPLIRGLFELGSRVPLPQRVARTAAMGPRGGDHLHVATEYFEE